MKSSEIRDKFLKFFEDKGHTVVESDLLVPRNDPTLLFTGAGMNQFKDQFMGKNISFKRATSCQKCLRTGDLENVGKTPRHHTFFEMLGNFSFGDYFKKDAIKWGWEFMTEVMGIPAEKLWISVYTDDDEAYQIWLNEVKIPKERIVKLGAHDNFWPQDAPTEGPNGPCGPCSEIFYDWGSEVGCGEAFCSPACDCGRFVEVWNLVFTQFDRQLGGRLDPLPSKNIDTGMGLERMVSVIQNVRTNFDTDLFVPIIDQIKDLLPYPGDMAKADLNLIADHIRAATFTIADGVSPSNEKRGYVVRKLIRRAYLRSGQREPFLYRLVPVVADLFKDVYPAVKERMEHIAAIVKEEERRFNETLESALPILSEMIEVRGKKLKGEDIFKLVDTYGLPVDVISLEAEKEKITLDMTGFETLMEKRKEQSRKGSDLTCEFIFQADLFKDAPKPGFSDELPLEATIEFILKEQEEVNALEKGDCAEIIISPQSSLFYAEAGGQTGDTGLIEKEDSRMEIVNTNQSDGRKVFQVVVTDGSFSKGDKITLKSDDEKKKKTARNHTATHLLQSALRKVLGDHVKQSGSFVDDRRLRFDFTHMKKLSDREIIKTEDMVNNWIDQSIGVCKEIKSQKEAKEEGALSFFGDKYGDTVRVVTVGDESKEFCGGTHVDNTQEIELFKIINETSVASGIRRIEALTGSNVKKWIKSELEALKEKYKDLSGKEEVPSGVKEEVERILSGKTEIDKASVHSFDEKIKPEFLKSFAALEKEKKNKEKQAQEEIFNELKGKIDKACQTSEKIIEVNFVSCMLEDVDMGMLRRLAGYADKKIDSGVLVLASAVEDKCYLVCAVTSDLTGKGIQAREVINEIAPIVEGKGGGNEAFAQAGGRKKEGLKEAVEKAKTFLEGRK